MPVYNLPMDTIPSPDAEETGSGEVTRAITKAFLSSPSFSRQFMNNAQQAMDGQAPAQGPAYGGDALSLSDTELLARTIAAEAGAHPADQPHVRSVIMNRVASPQYPNSVRGVIMQPGQFSAWNAHTGYAGGQGANDIVNRAAPASITDLARQAHAARATTDALNYYNPAAASPAWGGDGFSRIGNTAHVYGTARK